MPKRRVSNLSRNSKYARYSKMKRKLLREKQIQEENEKLQGAMMQLLAFQTQEAQAQHNWQEQLGRRAVDTQNTAEEKEQTSTSETDATFLSVIKTEILDPSEQNQEFILPDCTQTVTCGPPLSVTDSNNQDSSETSNFLPPFIKKEPVETDNAWSFEEFSESNSNNIKIGNSLSCEPKLTNCYVLLYDCLVPENLALISERFKHLKINTEISRAFSGTRSYLYKSVSGNHSFLLKKTLLLPHISEVYAKPVVCMSEPTRKYSMKKKFENKKVYTPNSLKGPKTEKSTVHPTVIYPLVEKRKRHFSGNKNKSCNCNKASKNAATMKSSIGENNLESPQQLCSCLSTDTTLSDPVDLLKKQSAFFDPNFGKISSSLNKLSFKI